MNVAGHIRPGSDLALRIIAIAACARPAFGDGGAAHAICLLLGLTFAEHICPSDSRLARKMVFMMILGGRSGDMPAPDVKSCVAVVPSSVRRRTLVSGGISVGASLCPTRSTQGRGAAPRAFVGELLPRTASVHLVKSDPKAARRKGWRSHPPRLRRICLVGAESA